MNRNSCVSLYYGVVWVRRIVCVCQIYYTVLIMSKSIKILIAFLFGFNLTIVGQEVKRMSLSELFELASEQNPDIGVANAKIAVSKQTESVAKNAYLPQISASLTLSYLGDGTILDRDFRNIRRDPLPHFNNSLGLELYQPIYTGGAIYSGVKASKIGTQLAETDKLKAENSVRMSIVTNYLELAKHNNLLKVFDDNIRLTEQLIEEMKTKHSEGIVLGNDITRYELRLSSISYDRLATRNAIDICNSNLLTLLGMKSEMRILPNIEVDSIAIVDSVMQKWVQLAAENAPSLESLSLRSDLEQLNRKITHSEYLPKIGIVAGDSFNGPVTFEVPALNKNYNAWFVGINIKWNISSLFCTSKATKKHELELFQIRRQKETVESNLNREIYEALTLYNQSVDRLVIEQKNLQLANENYGIVSNRFENGLALLTDMLDASNARLDAGVRLVNAEISTRYYYYLLHYIAGTISKL